MNKCIVCGSECRRAGARFCSRKCYAEYRQSYSVCPVCGIRFRRSPSDVSTHTCGRRDCKAQWRSISQAGRKMTEANEAIKVLPHTGHFETHHLAAEWSLLSPDGQIYCFRNLRLWAEKNTGLLPVSARTGKPVSPRTFEREIIRLKSAASGTEKNGSAHNDYHGWSLAERKEIKNMEDKLFSKLWKDALAQPDRELYIAEYGYPDWFDQISTDASTITDVLGNIHDVAHMSVRDMISMAGLTQSAFATRFCIPLRTIEDWVTEKHKCPDYTRLAFARHLGFLQTGKDNTHEQN